MAVVSGPSPSIVERLIEVAQTSPDAVAVASETETLSYRQLVHEVVRIARGLVGHPATRPGPVALLLGHDGVEVASFFGAVRAGRLAVALNGEDPPAYLRSALEVAAATTLLTDARREPLATSLCGGPSISVIRADRIEPPEEAADPPAPSGSAPCNLLFTSGSTGTPKAVVDTSERILENLVPFWEATRVGPGDRVAWLGALALGAQSLVVFGTLLNGATLCPYHLQSRGLRGLFDWLGQMHVSVLSLTPSSLRALLAMAPNDARLPDLRMVLVSGEPLHRRDVDDLLGRWPCRLVNVFGCTEQKTVGYLAVDDVARVTTDVVPVRPHGRHQRVVVVDAAGDPLPAGEVGDLVIATPFTTPGYWRGGEIERPSPPFCTYDGMPAYRTGDLARLDGEGLLHLVGRADLQIQVRGQRVEVEQVERALLGCRGVRAAAVVASSDAAGKQTLCALYERDPDQVVAARDLRRALAERLPGYMVPARLVEIDELPATAGGKLDRIATMRLLQSHAPVSAPAEPRDHVEQQLVTLWSAALPGATFGVDDDFFELGGDSLAAATMLAGVEAAFGIDLPPATLLDAPTVTELARLIRAGTDESAWPLLVCIRSRGAHPPLFSIPAAGFDPISLLPLSNRLSDQPMYAFRPLGIRDPGDTVWSVEDIAARYLAVASGAEHPPMRGLLGSSFGGLVAFEMALQMARRGERVPTVYLIDTFGPRFPRPRRDLGVFRRLKRSLIRILPVSSYATPNLAMLRNELAYRRELYLRLSGLKPPESIDAPALRYFRLIQKHLTAASRYTPAETFTGRVVLIRAERQMMNDLYETDETHGWRTFAPRLEVIPVDGRHEDLLREPAVAEVARALRAAQATDAPSPS